MLTADEELCDTIKSRIPGLLSCHACTSGLMVFVPEFICRRNRELTTRGDGQFPAYYQFRETISLVGIAEDNMPAKPGMPTPSDSLKVGSHCKQYDRTVERGSGERRYHSHVNMRPSSCSILHRPSRIEHGEGFYALYVHI